MKFYIEKFDLQGNKRDNCPVGMDVEPALLRWLNTPETSKKFLEAAGGVLKTQDGDPALGEIKDPGIRKLLPAFVEEGLVIYKRLRNRSIIQDTQVEDLKEKVDKLFEAAKQVEIARTGDCADNLDVSRVRFSANVLYDLFKACSPGNDAFDFLKGGKVIPLNTESAKAGPTEPAKTGSPQSAKIPQLETLGK